MVELRLAVPVRELLQLLGGAAFLTGRTVRHGLKRFEYVEFMRQIVQIGWRSTTIALLTSLFSAMVITVQFALQLARFGARGWVGSVVGVTLARELGTGSATAAYCDDASPRCSRWWGYPARRPCCRAS